MAITIQRKGYGQVEPNHLSAQYTGQIYAQLPAMTTGASASAIAQLENGQFLKYNYAADCASVAGDGEWMLVYCEEKLYDERHQGHKDFVLKNTDFTDQKIYPRLFKTNVGDIFTTNMFGGAGTGYDTTVASSVSLSKGGYLVPSTATGVLTTAAAMDSAGGMTWKIVAETTMPDGQTAVKIQRVQ